MANFLFLAILNIAYSNDINIEAQVTNNHVRPGDKIQYNITIKYKNNKTNIKEPNIESIKGLSLGQKHTSSGSHTSIINGTFMSQKTKTFSYTFTTDMEGKFTIPSYEIFVDDKKYYTNKIEINVSGNAPKKRGVGWGQSFFQNFFDDDNDIFNLFKPNEISESDLFIKIQVDKTDVYIGEKIQVSWYLYTTKDILNIAHLKYPTFEGFWKEDIEIPTRLSYQKETINNRQYKKALLYKYDLFPLKIGELFIDEYKARYKLAFGGEHIRESEKIKINVSPLPSEGKPAGFNNAVGEYNIHLKRIPNQVETNTPFNYTIVIDGDGNINKLTLPDINFDPFKIYDIVEDSHYETDASSQRKSFKEFDHLLIAQNSGKYSLPEIQFSFFSPKQEKYITQKIPSLELTAVGDNFIKPKENIINEIEEETDKLPYFETTINTHWIFSKHVTLALLMILCAFVVKQILFLPKKQTRLAINDRIKKLHDIKQPDKLSIQALSIISKILQNITGSNNPINSELIKLIPISKKHLRPKFEELISYFEQLAFFNNTNIDTNKLNKNIQAITTLSKLV